MYRCQSWTTKKAEQRRIDAFKLWCWRSLWEFLGQQGDQTSWSGRTVAEAEAPILWPPDSKSRVIGKDPDAGKDWRQEKGVTEDEMVGLGSRTRLSNFTFTFHFHALEKEMATHSSVLAGRIPGTGEPGRLPSKGSHRVGHDWTDLAAAAAAEASWFWRYREFNSHVIYSEN